VASALGAGTGKAAQLQTLSVGDVDITIQSYPAPGNRLIIWLPSEAGPQPVDTEIAEELSRQGVEVWRVDLLEANFLPVAASSMDQLTGAGISALLGFALESTGKRVAIVTTGRGAIPVLRGVHTWQREDQAYRRFAGVVLLSPKFFVETPDPGVAGELMPIVQSTNAPLFIIQPNQSPWYWKLPRTVSALEQGGSDVFVRVLKGVRDRYYFRPDATDYEKTLTRRLPDTLIKSVKLVDSVEKVKRRPPGVAAPPPVKAGKKDRYLQPYQGEPQPPPLALQDLHGKLVDLKKLQGNVVLVNFWASWCPPCVHEMPSMQRLKEKLAIRPFVILGVNMAEDRATVREFLQTKVSVDFPILFDTDGEALKAWGVFAFPTSYVVDQQGNIRYALFGSIEWDTPEIIDTLTSLME
jgi:thiol-disulfide isomerase/thioredoxin